MFIRIKDTGSHAINYQGGNSQQQTVLDNDQLSADWASYFPAPSDGAFDRINDAFSGNGTGLVLEHFEIVMNNRDRKKSFHQKLRAGHFAGTNVVTP